MTRQIEVQRSLSTTETYSQSIANLSYYMRKTLNNLPRISGESKNNCTRRFHADSNEPENAGKACYRAERG